MAGEHRGATQGACRQGVYSMRHPAPPLLIAPILPLLISGCSTGGSSSGGHRRRRGAWWRWWMEAMGGWWWWRSPACYGPSLVDRPACEDQQGARMPHEATRHVRHFLPRGWIEGGSTVRRFYQHTPSCISGRMSIFITTLSCLSYTLQHLVPTVPVGRIDHACLLPNGSHARYWLQKCKKAEVMKRG